MNDEVSDTNPDKSTDNKHQHQGMAPCPGVSQKLLYILAKKSAYKKFDGISIAEFNFDDDSEVEEIVLDFPTGKFNFAML